MTNISRSHKSVENKKLSKELNISFRRSVCGSLHLQFMTMVRTLLMGEEISLLLVRQVRLWLLSLLTQLTIFMSWIICFYKAAVSRVDSDDSCYERLAKISPLVVIILIYQRMKLVYFSTISTCGVHSISI